MKLDRPAHLYKPDANGIPLVLKSEAPNVAIVEKLMECVSVGLGVETSAAWAEVPSDLLRNWLARGAAEEKEPTDFSKIKDKVVLKQRQKFYEDVTVPCFALWKAWKKARSSFLIKCATKVMKSRTWQAQAWLLERVDPSSFARPGSPPAIKRELQHHEREVEAAIEEDPENAREVVQILLPANNR